MIDEIGADEGDDLDNIEWEKESNRDMVDSTDSIEIELSSISPKTKNKKRFIIQYPETFHIDALKRHQSCLVERVSSFLRCVDACRDIRLIETIRSCLPIHLFPQHQLQSLRFIRDICQWFSEYFTKVSDSDVSHEEGLGGSEAADLIEMVIPRKGGSSIQLNQIFTALLHGLKFRVRFVSTIDPAESFLPGEHNDLRKQRWEQLEIKEPYKPLRVRKEVNQFCWSEVYLPISNVSETVDCVDLSEDNIETNTIGSILRNVWGWVHVDALRYVFDNLEYVETKLRKGKAVHYVLAADLNGEISDVTDRYSKVFNHTSNAWKAAKKLADSFLLEWIRKENSKRLSSNERNKRKDLDDHFSNSQSKKSKKFEIEIVDCTLSEELPRLPTRLIDFKDHPVYLLERYLLANEVLHPNHKKAVGIFRGENVYLKEHKEIVKNKTQWRRAMRSVRPGEEPQKVTQKRFTDEKSDQSSSSGGNVTMKEISLFGIWQTDPLEIPAVIDDVLPSNEHGNIEIWDGLEQYVPAGAAYIRSSKAKVVATNLGIPFVPALTNFERAGAHTVPKLEGGIVLKRHEQLMLDAVYYMDAVKDETNYMKNEKRICQKWARLVTCLLNRKSLKETYGH